METSKRSSNRSFDPPLRHLPGSWDDQFRHSDWTMEEIALISHERWVRNSGFEICLFPSTNHNAFWPILRFCITACGRKCPEICPQGSNCRLVSAPRCPLRDRIYISANTLPTMCRSIPTFGPRSGLTSPIPGTRLCLTAPPVAHSKASH